MAFLRYLILWGAVLLSACTTVPVKQAALNQKMSWQQRQAELKTIKNWEAKGAIALRMENKADSASFNWQQQAKNYTIYLFGPMGMGSISLLGNEKIVELKTDKQHWRTKTPEALLLEVLGWDLPVSHLNAWIRGLPAQGSQAKSAFDEFHHMINLKQDGWDIDYQKFAQVNGIDLPSKIILRQNHLLIRIVITSWSIE